MTANKLTGLTLAVLVVFSSFVGAVAFSGVAAAGNTASDHNYDQELTDGSIYWAGQDLLVNASANESFSLYKTTDNGDTFVRQRSTGSGGHYVLDTSDLSGDYYIELSDGTQISFTIHQQDLNTSLDRDEVSNANLDNTAKFSVDSNRGTYDLNVSANGLSATTLADIFKNYDGTIAVNSDDDTITLKNFETASDSPNLNFTGVETGNYTFQFNVPSSSASSSTEISVVEYEEPNAEFAQSSFTGQEGDIIEVTVNLENTQTAAVQLGSERMNYVTNFTVEDKNKDGQVTVLFNTYTAGQSGFVPVATPQDVNDTVAIQDETTLSSPPLDTGSYTVELTVRDHATDVAAVNVQDRATEGVSTHIAPGMTKLSEVDDFRNETSASSKVAKGDNLVLKFDASGLEGQMSPSATAADLEKGSAYADMFGMYVTLEEEQPGMNREAKQLDVSKGTLIQDLENDTFYMVYDTSDFQSGVVDDGAYNATLHVTSDNPYVADGENETVSTTFDVQEYKASFDGHDKNSDSRFNLKSAEGTHNVTISGTTTAAPGTELTIVTRANGDNAFLIEETVTVTDQKTFSTTLNYENVADGTNFTLAVRDVTDRIESTYTHVPDRPAASISASDVTVTESASQLKVDDLYLPQGGYVVALSDSGERLAVSDYLARGNHTDLTFDLESNITANTTVQYVAVEDVNGNQVLEDGDAAFTVESTGKQVTAFASVVVEPKQTTTTNETTTPTNTTTPTDSTTPTDTATQTDSSNNTSPTETTTGKTPGFGIAVGLIALLGAALLAVRRD